MIMRKKGMVDDMAEEKNKMPQMGQDVFVAPGAVVVGDVTLGDRASVWYHCTLRGDEAAITVGEESNIQDNAVLHVDKEVPLVIGKGCSVGHSAVLHGCRIGDNTLIGMGAIVLNGANIGKDCIVGAGALVTQNKEIPEQSLVLGSPGKVVRKLTKQEIQANRENAKAYIRDSAAHRRGEYGYLT